MGPDPASFGEGFCLRLRGALRLAAPVPAVVEELLHLGGARLMAIPVGAVPTADTSTASKPDTDGPFYSGLPLLAAAHRSRGTQACLVRSCHRSLAIAAWQSGRWWADGRETSDLGAPSTGRLHLRALRLTGLEGRI
eukprot:3800318-Amphidinium_carterae.1